MQADSLNENMHNLLTSDLFGALKHYNPSFGLIPFLKRGINHSNIKPDFFHEVVQADYYFYPNLPALLHNTCLFIILRNKNESFSTVVLVPKLNQVSGFGDIDYNGPEPKEAGKGRHDGKLLAELYKELLKDSIDFGVYHDLKMKFMASLKRRYIFYITAHKSPPLQEKEIAREFTKEGFTEKDLDCLYWLNWQTAIGELEDSLNRSRQSIISEEHANRIKRAIYLIKLLLPI